MSDRFANRLKSETSPYLLQHAHNPVDWYPWGAEALQKARQEDKPIFLSVGYSACHWCHVMERESFEDEAIAQVMNTSFVNVKVDREERPDIDAIYMQAVQSLTGSGGWPMSVFLTPDLEPFFGGTYFPPRGAHGRPGFVDVLRGLAHAWTQDRENVVRRGRHLADRIAEQGRWNATAELDPGPLDHSLAALRQNFEPVWGGFGGAPKFPHALDLRLLLRHWKRTRDPTVLEMVTRTLDHMAHGGIYDQLGGGFHRYSTDEQWLIPHFEKMLYDTALLVPAYLDGYLATGREHYANVARESCEWALREMVTESGGFASSQDADTEGEEGRFFVWTPGQLVDVLGARDGAWAAAWFGVTEEGNFEHGRSALWRPREPRAVADELNVGLEALETAMSRSRRALFLAREQRVHPGTDDKVLVAWNGLMISALAQAWQILGEDRFLEAAGTAARFVWGHMRQPDGRLFATARDGRAHLNGYLDDYAFMIQALLDLYESDFDAGWLRAALELDATLTDQFENDAGGYFTVGKDHEPLIARLKNPQDGALPSGNGVQALNLLRLAELTGRRELTNKAQRTILSVGALVNRYPAAFSQLLLAVDFLDARPLEIVVAGDSGHSVVRAMLAEVRRSFLPQRVVALAAPASDRELIPLLEGREPGPGGARAFVCRDYACQLPADGLDELREQLSEAGSAA
jgi:uncharacterized protein YyaL (SSP411 family)